MRRVLLAGFLAVAVMAIPAGAAAQGLVEVKKERIKLGFTGAVAVPVGEFSDFVGVGGGVNMSSLFNVDHNGVFGIRLDGSFLVYGHERITRPFSTTIPRVLVDVHTNNWITSLGAGPQLTFGAGPIRPYVYGTLGFSYFATVSSVSGSAYFDDSFASSTNFDDFTFTTSGGAGMLIALTHGDKPVSLDLAVQTMRNGTTRYLRPGSIQERADGTVFITPIESKANLVTIKAGVVIGVL